MEFHIVWTGEQAAVESKSAEICQVEEVVQAIVADIEKLRIEHVPVYEHPTQQHSLTTVCEHAKAERNALSDHIHEMDINLVMHRST